MNEPTPQTAGEILIKRTRGRPPSIKPAQPQPAPKPKPALKPSSVQLHDVVQGVSGELRGILGQVGEINGNVLKCYAIRQEGQRDVFELKDSEWVLVGKPRVASRDPFPQPAPDLSQIDYDDAASGF